MSQSENDKPPALNWADVASDQLYRWWVIDHLKMHIIGQKFTPPVSRSAVSGKLTRLKLMPRPTPDPEMVHRLTSVPPLPAQGPPKPALPALPLRQPEANPMPTPDRPQLTAPSVHSYQVGVQLRRQAEARSGNFRCQNIRNLGPFGGGRQPCPNTTDGSDFCTSCKLSRTSQA